MSITRQNSRSTVYKINAQEQDNTRVTALKENSKISKIRPKMN